MQRHTRQALEIIFTTYSVQRIRDPSTDLYAVRELFRHAQAIFEILRTKPKFTPLLDPLLLDTVHDANVNALSLLLVTTGVRSLEVIAYGDNIHAGVRVDALSTLESLLELWEFLAAGPWAHAYSPSPHASPSSVLTFQLAHLAQTISSVSTDSIVRDAALVLIQHIARFDKTYAPVIALSRVARDVLALSPLWSMGVLASSVAMEHLMTKVVATSIDHAASKALFCTAVMHPNEGNRVVLPDAYLHAMESVLLNYPDCVGIVQFALDANEYGMFVMISRTSHVFAASLQNSAFGLENAIISAETSKAISDAFSVIVAKLRSGPADMLWQEICLNFGQFVLEHRPALSALLHSINLELDACAMRGVIGVDRLESLTELLYAMSTRIDSTDAFAVVQLSLQLIQLGAGPSTANMFEGTLVNAFNLMSEKDSLDLITTELALSICGPRARAALARYVPHMCLEDVDPTVRQAALRFILPHPDLIRTHSLAVIRSLYWIHHPMFKAEDASATLCVDQLALATEACPVLVVLAEVAPLYVKECVLKLLSAANISAVNDPLNEAKFISPHLDEVAIKVPRNALIRLVLSPAGIALLPLLVFLSAKWQQLVQEMVQSGFVVESTDIIGNSSQEATEFASLDRMVRSSRRGATPRSFQCTAQGRDTLAQLLGAEYADTAQTVPSRNQLHQLIVVEHDKGGFMKALRLANTMRAWYPDDYVQLGTHTLVLETLLPKVKDTHFPPLYSNGFTTATLDAFSMYYRIMHEVKVRCPVLLLEYSCNA
ncbi:hypothetical protein DYB34_002162 [Aphanomyces astaci]|uniref:Uncharacterized protein n=1 Tax=Aphanomyces astaci TaxID=112090 RepID=A0A3R6W4D6_APHAT|nr:hypothetical protein DYB34_002162 [Aphanomyces astaci]